MILKRNKTILVTCYKQLYTMYYFCTVLLSLDKKTAF